MARCLVSPVSDCIGNGSLLHPTLCTQLQQQLSEGTRSECTIACHGTVQDAVGNAIGPKKWVWPKALGNCWENAIGKLPHAGVRQESRNSDYNSRSFSWQAWMCAVSATQMWGTGCSGCRGPMICFSRRQRYMLHFICSY